MVLSSGQSGKETKTTDGEMVTITLKPIGPSRPRRLQLCSPIEVHDLRDLVAAEVQLPVESLKLVLHGKVLSIQNGNDAVISLHEGDTLMVAVAPSRPPKHICDPYDDEDDDLKFHIPEKASWVTWKVFFFLKDKVRIPGMRLKMWAIFIMWFILAPIAYQWHIGPLYILGTGFCIILFNLGQRRQGVLSMERVLRLSAPTFDDTAVMKSYFPEVTKTHILSSTMVLENFLEHSMQIVLTET